MLKAVSLQMDIGWLSWGKALGWLSCAPNWLFFHGTPFLLEKKWLTDELWLFRVGCLADIFSKSCKVSLSLWGKQLTIFVAGDKSGLSNQNHKTCVRHHGLASIPILKFSSNVTISVNAISRYCMKKSTNIWKITWHNEPIFFQITNAWCYRIVRG